MTKEIPIANWPPDRGMGLVVQVYVDDKPYLRFRPFKYGMRRGEYNHGAILKEFLGQLKIVYDTIVGSDLRIPMPTPNGERYSVVGMGDFEVDDDNHSINFIRFNPDYRVYEFGINQKHLDDIVRLCPEWTLRRK
ncbi:hypothetical protein HYY70_05095 [Candidatus Woesearchaeota archaeon]|nr:hypothetical protein [Candidatus Woesearchaeota archaeon]